MLGGITLTRLIIGAFVAYVLNSAYVFYTLFNPKECKGNADNCLMPAYKLEHFNKIKVSVYVSRLKSPKESDLKLIWDSGDTSVLVAQEKIVNVTLPFSTRRNGSLYAYAFLHPMKEDAVSSGNNQRITFQSHLLTKFMIPKDKQFNLIQGNKDPAAVLPITHIHPKISIYVGAQDRRFQRNGIPHDIYHLLKTNGDGEYLPLLYIDQLSMMKRYLLPVQRDTENVTMQIYVTPVSLGRLRLWATVEQALEQMKDFGLTENDLDEVKGIFTDTNLYFLALTFVIAIVHMLFDVLAFKNDVSFWKKKESMEGMSVRTVVWRCISTTIIFLYLMDEKTSLIVLVPSGIGAVIEFWKVTKALKISIEWTSSLPRLKFGEKSKSEQQTDEFDVQAMKYLSYGLYPLMAAAAVYSLIYQPHKSWYSWLVRSLVNGIYAFGFLFMLPQLFLNYKLKSVAHLPWRAFMYKAFNTFIDDVFAFIVVMPTAHRVACFRDDIVFVVYLYQRWLYPVDTSRANEFGMTFDDDNKTNTATETKKEK